MEHSRKLSSEELAQLIVDAIAHAGMIAEDRVEDAIEVATAEIDARKALGDY